MTAPPQLAEFVSAYVVEVEEHLASANTQLLAIEAALRRGEANLRGVRETFRALHTIKGLSAMVGVDQVVAIAHRMEGLLRAADRAGAKLPASSIDTLLRGLRAIEQRIRALGEGKPVPAAPPDLLIALDMFDTEQAHGAPPAPVLDLPEELASKLAALELEQLQKAMAGGQRAVRVDFVPSPFKAERGLNINSVREQIGKLGEIIKVLPVAVDASSEAPGGLSFAIILVTGAEDEAVAAAAGAEPGSVQVLGQGAPKIDVQLGGSLPPPDLELDQSGESLQPAIVRVPVARLDRAMDHLSALIVTRFRLSRAVAALSARGVDTQEISHILGENTRQLRELRASILKVRMVSISEVLDRMPLLVRGLRRSTQKLVRLEIDAGGAELDKAVAERLFPALVHLVRNAVDHAVETPDERVRRGKPEEGLLRIRCTAHANARLELSVSDDGRGIDAEAVAKRAGKPVPDSAGGLLELLCTPGLSTRDVATTTSGRGMGMEIVKRITVDDLRGELFLTTELGVGTTFTLRVPLTLSIVEAFSFECAAQRFVVPVAMIEEIVEVDASAVGTSSESGLERGGVRLMSRRGEVVPLFSLARVFGIDAGGEEARKALVVRRGSEPMAFGVDRLLGQQEVVVRPLEDTLVKVPGVSGATDLGDGRPTLVLDLLALGTSVAAGAGWVTP